MKNDINIPKSFIQQLEQKLGLTYIEEEQGNVCMANNNSELRDDFKQSFTMADVLNYIKAAGSEGKDVRLPENAEEFWNIIAHGLNRGL